MLQFKNLALDDASAIRPYFLSSKSRLSDNSLGGVMMWRDYFQARYAIEDDTLYFKVLYVDGQTAFTVPLGKSCDDACDMRAALDKLGEYCGRDAGAVEFCSVSSASLEHLKANCRIVKVVTERDWYDYLYESADIIELPGKKFSGQRNHINRFKRMYNGYSFEPIGPDNIDKAIFFLGTLFDDAETDGMALAERAQVLEVFKNFEAYGMLGGVIVVDGAVVAVSAGEVMNDTLFVHIEKANRDYHGAYQVMVNEFARHFAKGVRYINREEDLGREGLRKSKLSYHPVRLLEKSTVLADLRR